MATYTYIALYCMTCSSLYVWIDILLFLSWIQRFWKVTTFYDRVNNLKETSFRIEEFDLVHLRFALPKIPAKVVVKFAIVSSPSASWASRLLTAQLEMNIVKEMEMDGNYFIKESSPAQGELRSSPSRPLWPSSPCCSLCSPPTPRCSRQNLSS